MRTRRRPRGVTSYGLEEGGVGGGGGYEDKGGGNLLLDVSAMVGDERRSLGHRLVASNLQRPDGPLV